MQEIMLCKLEKWIKTTCMSADVPYIIVGNPCESLYALQQAGHCVLAELKHLQGLSDEEVAEALCKDDAVIQYENVCINAGQLSQAYLRRIWCKHIGEPVLIAETERLIIRESVEADAETFYELYQDEACRKYLETPPVSLSGNREAAEAEYRRYIAQYQKGQYAFYEYGMWSMVEKTSGRCIGRAGVELQAEGLSLGYAVLPQFRGKGYATEACRAVLEYSKECEYADEIYVKIARENEASLAVYGRLKKQSLVTLKLSQV